jgi:hypothetical protein
MASPYAQAFFGFYQAEVLLVLFAINTFQLLMQ